MNKFKIGDKVKIIKLENIDISTNLAIGDIGTITNIENGEFYLVKWDKPFVSDNANYCRVDNTYLMCERQLELIEQYSITIPLHEYKELCKTQARLQVLVDFIQKDKFINTNDIFTILGVYVEREDK